MLNLKLGSLSFRAPCRQGKDPQVKTLGPRFLCLELAGCSPQPPRPLPRGWGPLSSRMACGYIEVASMPKLHVPMSPKHSTQAGEGGKRRSCLRMMDTFLGRKTSENWVNSAKPRPNSHASPAVAGIKLSGSSLQHPPPHPTPVRESPCVGITGKKNSFYFSERFQNDPINCDSKTHKAN